MYKKNIILTYYITQSLITYHSVIYYHKIIKIGS